MEDFSILRLLILSRLEQNLAPACLLRISAAVLTTFISKRALSHSPRGNPCGYLSTHSVRATQIKWTLGVRSLHVSGKSTL